MAVLNVTKDILTIKENASTRVVLNLLIKFVYNVGMG